MTTLVADMTKEELVQVIETVIEQKLMDLFDDLDAGLELKPSVRERLLRQKETVAQGERGQLFGDVLQELGLS
jgi:uncharacterized protein YbcI